MLNNIYKVNEKGKMYKERRIDLTSRAVDLERTKALKLDAWTVFGSSPRVTDELNEKNEKDQKESTKVSVAN